MSNKYYNSVTSCIKSPYNIHILNIINTINNLYKNSIFSNNLELTKLFDFFYFINCKNNNIFINIDLNEQIVNSDSFVIITSSIETFIQNLRVSDYFQLPHLNKLFDNLINIIKGFENSKQDHGKLLEYYLEILESDMDNFDIDILQNCIINKINDKNLSCLLFTSITDLASSLYGLLESLSYNAYWKDIISDKTLFDKMINNINNINNTTNTEIY